MDTSPDRLQDLHERVLRLESLLNERHQQAAAKDWYTTAEVAGLLSKAEFTVREWCRLGRIYARKRACGRGPTPEWMIAHNEVERYRNHGLLPAPRFATKY